MIDLFTTTEHSNKKFVIDSYVPISKKLGKYITDGKGSSPYISSDEACSDLLASIEYIYSLMGNPYEWVSVEYEESCEQLLYSDVENP